MVGAIFFSLVRYVHQIDNMCCNCKYALSPVTIPVEATTYFATDVTTAVKNLMLERDHLAVWDLKHVKPIVTRHFNSVLDFSHKNKKYNRSIFERMVNEGITSIFVIFFYFQAVFLDILEMTVNKLAQDIV